MSKQKSVNKRKKAKRPKAVFHNGSHDGKAKAPIRVIGHTKDTKLRQAVDLLCNNRLRDMKCSFKSRQEAIDLHDSDSVALASSLVDLNTIYRFRLTNNNNLPTSGAGVIAGYQSADPSGGSGSTWTAAEWSSLVTLFSEVRLMEFQMWFSVDRTGLTSGSPLWISGVLSSAASAPSTVENVLDNADAVQWNIMTTTAPTAFRHTLKPQGQLGWAIVTTANPGSYAGIPGSIQFYGGSYPNSVTHVLYYSNVVFLEFRSRI